MKKLILIALTCSITFFVFGNGDGETRSTTVKLDISTSDRISIQAKNTELIVETWDKNSMEIEASIRYDGKMTDKMIEFLNQFEQRVKDKISKGAGDVRVDTDLDLPNKIQIGGKHVGINVSYGDENLKVLYRIKAPGTNSYTITNSYEDVRLIGNFDKVEFTQYSGELEAGNIKSAKLNMKYGSATIESIGNASMEIYEQKLNSRNIGELEINTKYSDLELRKVGTMKATSYESDIQIGSIRNLSGDFKYGEIKVNEKLETAELTLYEMDIEAEEIEAIKLLNSKYSEIEAEKVGSIVFEQSYEDQTSIGTLGSFKSTNSKYGNHSIELLLGSLILNAYEDEVEIDRLGPSATEISIDGKYIDFSIGTGSVPFVLITKVKYGKVDYNESQVDVKRYIKDNDQLEVEAHSKAKGTSPVKISVKGYEVDVKVEY
ncbi:hypothetical protein [Ekhidna sp.]|uniref:hypothetical protein n=1 Tax=Ekhidna sp. TaxID=2608089 RepID=UPI003515678C